MIEVLNTYAAAYDEAIVAGLFAVALVLVLQAVALVRAKRQIAGLKDVVKTLVSTATKAVLTSAVFAAREVAKYKAQADDWQRLAEEGTLLAEAGAEQLEAAVTRAEQAERALQEIDDEEIDDNAEAPFSPYNTPFSGEDRVEELLFGGLRPRVRAFRIGRDGELRPVDGGGTFNRDPGTPPPSLDDLARAIGGDASGIERALGARPGSLGLRVLDEAGVPLSASQRADAIRSLSAAGRGDTPETKSEDVYSEIARTLGHRPSDG